MADRRLLPALGAFLCVVLVLSAGRLLADDGPSPRQVLSEVINTCLDILEPPAGTESKTFVTGLTIVRADGLPGEVAGATARLAFQAPDHVHVEAKVGGNEYLAGRDGNQIWVDEPGKHFALLGTPGVARFRAEPGSIDHSVLPPMSVKVSRRKVSLTTFLMLSTTLLPEQRIGDTKCHVLHLAARGTLEELLGFHAGEVELWVRQSDHLPARIVYSDGGKIHVQVDFTDTKLIAPLPAEVWKLQPAPGDHVDTVAVSHLLRFLDVAPKMLMDKCPPLPAARGRRKVIGTEGKGRLEMIDGARLLFLKGTPEEMGQQHGVLLRDEIHAVCTRILYGVGVGSSFVKGAWFFGEVEGAQARLLPFMNPRYLAEEDAIARASGMNAQEARLANFFPELFHCSGFAIFGKATSDGHIYHGRVLDYLRGVGLEQHAVTIVHQPDVGHAWINISYAGFVGSVTAMNDQGISIGEMGGGGYGAWDGKPMAHLVREVMENAGTLDEAVKIMRESPRTCQYYYVIADGKTHTAIGISANPKEFITIKPGESHPLLPRPQPDAVLLSAGQRYEELVNRVQGNYGHFDADSARKLMDPPVCMKSNIQSVLFQPDTLDLWVANADSEHVASETRYTHYNLRELLARSGN
jgi:outer membrane lipoprotein-sorting protein